MRFCRWPINYDLAIVYRWFIYEKISKELQEYVFDNFRPIWQFPADSGHKSCRENLQKSRKIEKKCDFSKFENILYSGRKYDIWPEIDPLDPGKSLESLYWPSHTIWYNSKKNQKNRIFDLQNSEKNLFSADFPGRCGPAIKTILGIKTSYQCPKDPIMSPYPRPSFLLVHDPKIQLSFCKIDYFNFWLFT